MDIRSTSLSTLNSPTIVSSMDGVNIKQFKRKYSGGFEINFPQCLSNANDIKTINYTNFYLTDKNLLDDYFTFPVETLVSKKILTKIKFSDDFLSYTKIDPTPYLLERKYRESLDYYVPIFDSAEGSYFFIEFVTYNTCHIYFINNGYKYYMALTLEKQIVFCKDTLLSFDPDTLNPQDFNYLYSESSNGLLLFKNQENEGYIIVKSNNILEPKENIRDYFDIPFTIDRNIFTRPTISNNTSFVVYDNLNNVDQNKSATNLQNNYLLHKKTSDNSQILDIISLKNQVSNNEVFTNSNNLLSSLKESIFVDSFREYTNICQDIIEEESDDLKTNYVFYNKTYTIVPGINKIISPETLYPFKTLNINDTKFVNSGAFSFVYPMFSDRIYRLSNKPNESSDGQYLLCTWLSGHPNSPNKIWVDRYYYPDLITKEEALLSTPLYDSTYGDPLESLIMSNTDLKDAISNIKFFDKKSDLAFSPNETYEYHRVNYKPEIIIPIATQCESNNYPINYFEEINNRGKFTLSFYFNGRSNWVLKSDRNDIDVGLTISNNGNTLDITYSLYDPFQETYTTYFSTAQTILSKYNIFCLSIDSMVGTGYIFLNNDIIYTFNLPQYKYIKSQLLNGDFCIVTETDKVDLLKYTKDDIINITVSYDYLDSAFLYLLSIFENFKNDDIYITLPCGMRNNIDNLKILNDICNSGAFKSNDINIIIKNIKNSDLLDSLKDYLIENLTHNLPTNTNINKITFQNFKNYDNNNDLSLFINNLGLYYDGEPLILS